MHWDTWNIYCHTHTHTQQFGQFGQKNKENTCDFVTQKSVMVPILLARMLELICILREQCTQYSLILRQNHKVKPSVPWRKVRRGVDENPALKTRLCSQQIGGDVETCATSTPTVAACGSRLAVRCAGFSASKQAGWNQQAARQTHCTDIHNTHSFPKMFMLPPVHQMSPLTQESQHEILSHTRGLLFLQASEAEAN